MTVPPRNATVDGTKLKLLFTMASAADAEVVEKGTPVPLYSQPACCHNGTASIKAGFAGSSKPRYVEKSARPFLTTSEMSLVVFALGTL
jgi:hypothetical protein